MKIKLSYKLLIFLRCMRIFSFARWRAKAFGSQHGGEAVHCQKQSRTSPGNGASSVPRPFPRLVTDFFHSTIHRACCSRGPPPLFLTLLTAHERGLGAVCHGHCWCKGWGGSSQSHSRWSWFSPSSSFFKQSSFAWFLISMFILVYSNLIIFWFFLCQSPSLTPDRSQFVSCSVSLRLLQERPLKQHKNS